MNRITLSSILAGGSLIFGGFTGISTAGESGSLTLNDAIVRALALDPGIRNVGADIREAAGFSKEMKSALGPQIRLEGGAGYAKRERSFSGFGTSGEDLFSRQISLIGEQLLWDNGFHWYRWKDAEKREEAKALLEEAQRETTALATVEAYLAVLQARKQIALARENLDVHNQIGGLARDRAEAAGNQADIELSAARRNLASVLLKERELALRQAEYLFFRYVGVHPPANMWMPKVPRIESKDRCNPAGNFHYQAVLHQKEAANLAKEAVDSRYAPRLLFRGTGSLGEDVSGIEGVDNEVSALVVVQWDLFESGRKEGLREQAMADIDRQNAIIDETLILLTQDIDSRWAEYSTKADRIGIVRKYEEELTKTGDLYQEQFELGTRPLLSILDIKNEKIGASIRLVDEEHEFAMLAYRLLSFGGQLITETVGPDYLDAPVTAMGVETVHPSSVIDHEAVVEVPEKRAFRPFQFLRKPGNR